MERCCSRKDCKRNFETYTEFEAARNCNKLVCKWHCADRNCRRALTNDEFKHAEQHKGVCRGCRDWERAPVQRRNRDRDGQPLNGFAIATIDDTDLDYESDSTLMSSSDES